MAKANKWKIFVEKTPSGCGGNEPPRRAAPGQRAHARLQRVGRDLRRRAVRFRAPISAQVGQSGGRLDCCEIAGRLDLEKYA